MYDQLDDGGTLVTFASTSWEHGKQKAQQAFQKWLIEVEAEIEVIEAGEFKASGTQIETRLITIHKPELNKIEKNTFSGDTQVNAMTQESAMVETTSSIDMTGRKPDELVYMDPKAIKPPRFGNPRDSISDADYNSLKESIKAHAKATNTECGIHTPVAVWAVEDGYELICGNTRRSIAIDLNYSLIPVLVKDVKNADEAEQLALSENVDRNAMTLLQEARGLKKVVTACGGDIEAAASRMGWGIAKFKKALQLLKATPKVQSLIGMEQPNGFKLSEGHAALLALISPKIQDRLVDAVIHDKLTVNKLSDQVNKRITLPLDIAPFCKNECETCEYNSKKQTALLPSLSLGDNMCSNPICYKMKRDNFFADKQKEMQEEYGKIVLKSTVEISMEVTESLVGEEQLKQCQRCDMYCAILNDKTGLGQGQVDENQCINPTCLKKKMKALMLANTKPLASTDQKETPVAQSDADAKDNDKQQVSTDKAVTVPNRCKFSAQKTLRALGTNALLSHPNYKLALSVAALLQVMNKGSVPDKIDSLLSKTKEELDTMYQEALVTMTASYQDSGFFNMEKAVIKTCNTHVEDFKSLAVSAWQPTLENLTEMTKQIRIIVLEDSGFAKAYQDAHSKKEYAQLLAKKADLQVKAILAFQFDWSHYAPDFYIESIDKPYYH